MKETTQKTIQSHKESIRFETIHYMMNNISNTDSKNGYMPIAFILLWFIGINILILICLILMKFLYI